ncbi:MAG: radical SAM protein, partial [Planctomycetes bacterium]|nr:radical SAM protein [Planctomycetota bacterium]
MNSALQVHEALRRKRAGRPVWEWFDRRVRTHQEATAGLGGRMCRGDAACRRLAAVLDETHSDRPRVLYLHVPFCRRICTFCAFIRQAVSPAIDPYVAALGREIDAVARRRWSRARPFAAVYFGGGTPTVLDADSLVGLVRQVRERFPLDPTCEFTVEARFDGVDEDYLACLRDAGVNRVSFGVQTFDTQIRGRIGRVVDHDGILRTLDAAGRLGFGSISVDLIYNLPGQTEATWADDLRCLASTPASGASVYGLIPFPNSGLCRAIAAGQEPPLGGINVEYYLHRQADRALLGRPGWRRMLPFHYGREGVETRTYNGSRLGGVDVLGLGCGAGGELNGVAYMHEMDVARFI